MKANNCLNENSRDEKTGILQNLADGSGTAGNACSSLSVLIQLTAELYHISFFLVEAEIFISLPSPVKVRKPFFTTKDGAP